MFQRNAASILGICLLLSACGSGETISFKGVPLGQPGAKDALKKICQESQSNKDNSCSFKERRELIWLSYGVLSHNLAWVTLDKDDSLVEIEITGSKAEIRAQVETLTAKYGGPAKTAEQVTNGLGTKFDKETYIWTDRRGSQITVESIYEKIDEGRIVIDSASSVAAKKDAERSLIKAGKNNL